MKKKILFVDDDFLLRELMSEMLSEMDYDVDLAESSEEAVHTFHDHPKDYDLVLTDLLLLDGTGDEVAKKIRSIRADIPVVVMTGTPHGLPPIEAEAAGVCKVLPKPLTRAELVEGLRDVF